MEYNQKALPDLISNSYAGIMRYIDKKRTHGFLTTLFFATGELNERIVLVLLIEEYIVVSDHPNN